MAALVTLVVLILVKEGAAAKCQPGTVSPDGLEPCTDCTPGSFAEDKESTSCELCAAGTYSQGPRSDSCKKCAKGHFASNTGSTVCDECPVNTYQDEVGQSLCINCPEWETTDGTGKRKASDCTLEYPLQTLTCESSRKKYEECFPIFLSANAYISNDTVIKRQTSKTDCVLGDTYWIYPDKITVDNGCKAIFIIVFEFSESICSPGTFSSNGFEPCTDCAAGSFAEDSNSTFCDMCPPGTYSPQPRSVTCVVCNEGHFAAMPGSFTCVECPVNTYQDEVGQEFCYECPDGETTVGPGKVVPTDCAPNCQPGTYSSNGTEPCTECAAGTFAAGISSTSCDMCPPGTYSPQPRSVACTNCSKGHFASASQSTTCMECPANTYQNETGRIVCIDCPDGNVTDGSGQTDISDCLSSYPPQTLRCKSNKYQYSECFPTFPAPNVHISNETYMERQTSKTDCVLGETYWIYPDKIAVDNGCKAVFVIMFEISTLTLTCLPGTFSSNGSAPCTDCVAGSFTEYFNSTFCDMCPPGTYSSHSRSVGCVVCNKGHFTSSSGSTDCDECPANTYQNATGADFCIDCLNGTTTNGPGKDNILDCLSKNCRPGTSSPNGLKPCIECVAGSFAQGAKSTSCELCPPGTYSSEPQSVVCKKCSKGHFGSSAGLTACMECSNNTYQNETGENMCIDCPDGSVTDGPGKTDMSDCISPYPPQTLQCKSIKKQYLECFPSFPAPNLQISYETYVKRKTSKTDCIIGETYWIYPDKIAVDKGCRAVFVIIFEIAVPACQPGTFSLNGFEPCTNCSAGSFADDFYSKSCEMCLPGTYSPHPGSVACVMCDKGHFASSTGSTSCVECPVNTYQVADGQVSCIQCLEKKITKKPGKTKESECLLPIEFKASIKLSGETWQNELADHNSQLYKDKKRDFENQMDAYYSNSRLGNMYIGTVINDFRPGSVIADFALIFDTSTSSDEDETFQIDVNIVITVLKEQVTEQSGAFDIDLDSVDVESGPLVLITPHTARVATLPNSAMIPNYKLGNAEGYTLHYYVPTPGFTFDSSTGLVTKTTASSEGSVGTYMLVVSDGKELVVAATITFTTFVDYHDPWVEGFQVYQERRVREIDPIGTEINTDLFIRDGDEPLDGFTYELSGGDSIFFTLGYFTGVLKTNVDLDFEEKNMYNVIYTISDSKRASASVNLVIWVDDYDEAPVCKHSSINRTVSKEKKPGTLVDTVSCWDPEGADVTYWIQSGNSQGIFAIGKMTGTITLTKYMPFTESRQVLKMISKDWAGHESEIVTVTIDFKNVISGASIPTYPAYTFTCFLLLVKYILTF